MNLGSATKHVVRVSTNQTVVFGALPHPLVRNTHMTIDSRRKFEKKVKTGLAINLDLKPLFECGVDKTSATFPTSKSDTWPTNVSLCGGPTRMFHSEIEQQPSTVIGGS